ncbi:hypothetical protein HanIR_Chr13g0636851 [Helianthus annuus]|nr:hypothetical protein HanIR_Chr13g0636851 [Helianthus annuus]
MSSCGTKPTIFLYEWIDSFFPFIKIIPDMLHPVIFPVKADKNVVFPAPEGPITADILPGKIFPLTHLIIFFRFPFNVNVSSLNATSILGRFRKEIPSPSYIMSMFIPSIAFSLSI